MVFALVSSTAMAAVPPTGRVQAEEPGSGDEASAEDPAAGGEASAGDESSQPPEGLEHEFDAAEPSGIQTTNLPEQLDLSPAHEVAEELRAEFDVPVEQAVVDELDAEGAANFWVVFDDRPDLTAASEIDDWGERGQFVYDRLTATAEASQAGLAEDLSALRVAHERFWLSNAVLVRGGDVNALRVAGARDGLAGIRADEVFKIPEPVEEDDGEESGITAVEWGVSDIQANLVWTLYETHGKGAVVGSIDTGVEYTHSALVEQYRGNLGGGAFDHDYNWWDPSNVCPDFQPCDNHDHGTHVTGTMVGDDGEDNQIGVAPGAQWIAAKGCASGSCSSQDLLSSGQFMLAPTDRDGENPRPELRPHVVNNSWGSSGHNPWYRDIVTGWTAAGIFGVFSNGNNGPSCGSTGSPADYVESWGVGAYNSSNEIAGFSSRGPGEDGVIRPSISAPGVHVRSSVRGDGYATFSGTSMAAPHQSGAVALMVSAAPVLTGDVEHAREILADTATDMDDTVCGGTPEHNNVWGHGRLNALDAVEQSPRGPSGAVSGTVTDAVSGDPLEGATVTISFEELPDRSARTDADGGFEFTNVPVGTHDVTVETFAYEPQTQQVEIVEDETSTVEIALERLPSHAVEGTVTEAGGDPVAGATVTIQETPLTATTGADGTYAFEIVPEGDYTMTVAASNCLTGASIDLVVDRPQILDFELERRTDAWGHTCRHEPTEWIQAIEPLDIQRREAREIDLPFPFPFYGAVYNSINVSFGDAFVNFGGLPSAAERSVVRDMPDVGAPNTAIYPFWRRFHDRHAFPRGGEVRTATLGVEGDRRFVIEWDLEWHGGFSPGAQFEVVLHENGEILFQYSEVDETGDRGQDAFVGLENAEGTDAFQYSSDEPALSDEHAIRFFPPDSGPVSGTVTDGNDDVPVAEAIVTATRDDGTTAWVRTDDDGAYAFELLPGTWEITVERSRYATETRAVEVEADADQRLDVALATETVDLDTTPIEVTVPFEGQHVASLPVTAGGTGTLEWQLGEALDSGRSPGTVITHWNTANMGVPDGAAVAPDGNLWATTTTGMSGAPPARIIEYTTEGHPTGRVIDLTQFGMGGWLSDQVPSIVYDTRRDVICGVVNSVLSPVREEPIRCWDLDGESEVARITVEPHLQQWQYGAIAYNPDDDTFYIGNAHRREQPGIFQVAGLSHPDPGAMLGHCHPADPIVGALAYDRSSGVLWATRTLPEGRHQPAHELISPLDPADCSLAGDPVRWAHPSYMSSNTEVGLSVDADGNLWMTEGRHRVYFNLLTHIESGIPSGDVPWLGVPQASGSLAPGEGAEIEIVVDTTGLEPGTYRAHVGLRTNAGRDPRTYVPVRVEVEPPPGAVSGTITDANDGEPVAGAALTATSGEAVWTATTDSDGGFQRPLPVGTWTVEVSADGYVTETREVVVDDPDGQEITLDVALPTGAADLEPGAVGASVSAGGRHTADVTVTNSGTAELTGELFERGPVGSGAEASDASSAPFPDEPRILVYADGNFFDRDIAPITVVETALRALDLPYTIHYELNSHLFEEDLTTEDWDLVILARDFFGVSDVHEALDQHISSGGTLIMQDVYYTSREPSPVFRNLGVALARCLGWCIMSRPAPVSWWDGDHQLFTASESVPEFPDSSGVAVDAYPGFQAPAGFTEEPTRNEANLVLGNNYRTLYKGFFDASNEAADRDGDGVHDTVELWQNMVASMLRRFTGDVPWLDVSAQAISLAPGESVDLEVTVDAADLDRGEHAAEVVLMADAGRHPEVSIPISIDVFDPGTVSGTVTDANDELAVEGVRVTATSDGVTRETRTDGLGAYELGLPLGTWTVEFSADGYVTESREVVVDDPDGQELTVDAALRTSIASVDPDSISASVPARQESTVELDVANPGTAELVWETLERGGLREPDSAVATAVSGELEWIQPPPEEGVLLEGAEGQVEAFPSAARWTPDEVSSDQPRILVYADDGYHPAPNTYVDQALQRLGLAYTAYYDGNFDGFEEALWRLEGWDLVIFANENFFVDFRDRGIQSLHLLEEHAANGGQLVAMAAWQDWDYVTSHPLWETMEVEHHYARQLELVPSTWWEPYHTAFTDPESTPEFTDLDGSRYPGLNSNGDGVRPLDDALALAGFTDRPQDGEATMVLGNDGRTLFRGFEDGFTDADADGDEIPDGVELWTNLIHGMQHGFSADVPWLDVPDSGTVAPDGNETVEVTLDAADLEPGEYTATLIFDTNAGRERHVVIPVSVEVVPAGTLSGTVTDADDGAPIAGATVTATDGERTRTTSTGEDGSYALTLELGTWTVTVEADGYQPSEGHEVTLSEDGEAVSLDVELARAPDPVGTVSGTVSDAADGASIAGAAIEASDGERTHTTTSGEDGGYELVLELGRWTITTTADGYDPATVEVTVSEPGEEIPLDIELAVEELTFDDVRERVREFETSGDVTDQGARKLLDALDRAERHHDGGRDAQAIRELEQFKEIAADPRYVPSEPARDALIADADRLISQLEPAIDSDPGRPRNARGASHQATVELVGVT